MSLCYKLIRRWIVKAPKCGKKCWATTVSIAGVALVWVLGSAALATAQPYADSAHGNGAPLPGYGVNRSGTGYDTGSCAHCHDTLDDSICGVNELMLFAPNNPTSQTDNFCFQCHKGSGSVQVGGVTNNTYSTNFGGGTATLATIYDAFNPTTGVTPSSHNLSDVLNHAVGRDIGFTTDTNACLVCHDQHLAQQNYPVTLSGLGGVKTAIRRPLDYANPPTNLWGDEDDTSGFNERLLDYTNKYQAPYYLGGTTYEPAGDSTTDGSNLPNFFNFCMNQCHTQNNVYSTERTATLTQIDWSTDGDVHGRNHDDQTAMGYTIAPYEDPDEDYNYVLSCTDCHEPHGSENEWLLRTCVNGKDDISVNWAGDWWEFCTACHVLTNATNMYHRQREESYYPGCPVCHYHGAIEGMGRL